MRRVVSSINTLMKHLLLILLTLSSTSALALPLKVTCATDPVATIFVIEETDERIEITTVHANGMEYAPLDVRMITPNDVVNYLPKKVAALKKIPETTTFSWPKNKCTIHDGFRFECYGTDDVQTHEGVKLAPFGVWSERIINQNPAGQYVERAVTMSVDVDGETVHVRMIYPENGCTVNGSNLRGPFAK